MISLFQVSKRPFSNQIRKKITRIPDDCQITEEQVEKDSLGPNDRPPVKLINRNPRNMEQLLFERKPRGWELDRVPVLYWNRLVMEKFRSHIAAKVIHHSGRTVLSASSNEEGISSQLSSPLSLHAVECLGKVLARRCLESGILYVKASLSEEQMASPKAKLLLETLVANGVSLKEPHFIFPRYGHFL